MREVHAKLKSSPIVAPSLPTSARTVAVIVPPRHNPHHYNNNNNHHHAPPPPRPDGWQRRTFRLILCLASCAAVLLFLVLVVLTNHHDDCGEQDPRRPTSLCLQKRQNSPPHHGDAAALQHFDRSQTGRRTTITTNHGSLLQEGERTHHQHPSSSWEEDADSPPLHFLPRRLPDEFRKLLHHLHHHHREPSSTTSHQQQKQQHQEAIDPQEEPRQRPTTSSSSSSNEPVELEQRDPRKAYPLVRMAQDAVLRSPMELVGDDTQDETIFVSIAAFRDAECSRTVEHLYGQARFPQRVFSGIVDQRTRTDSLCLPASFRRCQSSFHPRSSSSSSTSLFCPLDNLRFRQIAAEASRGPTFGRYLAYLLYQGETYYMMIDSHNRFAPHWDVLALFQWHQLPRNPTNGRRMGVLSYYPPGYREGITDVSHGMDDTAQMCYEVYNRPETVAIMRNKGVLVGRIGMQPLLQPFTGAGFLFGDASFALDVPFDPYLDNVFDGEEVLYSARLFTHGYDSYSPSRDPLFHFYTRANAPKVWDVGRDAYQQTQRRHLARAYFFLNLTKRNASSEPLVVLTAAMRRERRFRELAKYGMGSQRTLEEFWRRGHVDPVRRVTDSGACFQKKQSPTAKYPGPTTDPKQATQFPKKIAQQ